MARSVALLLLLWTAVATAQPQGYPNRPVHVICPFPPGGGVDIVTRLIAGKLGEAWGQPVLVDNRAGAGGTLGTAAAVKAAPDGYTLLMGGAGALAISPALSRNIQYDPIKDLVPVALVGTTPMVLVVHPSLDTLTLRELVTHAKANPGKLAYASAGVGSILHLTMEMFRSMAGIEVVHVAYKGAAPAVTDLLGGQVAMMVADLPLLQPHIGSGKVRALGVTTAARSSQLPGVPTMAESGLPGFEALFWHGVFAPAAVAPQIVSKVSSDLAAALRSPDLQGRLRENGVAAVGSSPEALRVFLASEIAKWARIVKESGATSD